MEMGGTIGKDPKNPTIAKNAIKLEGKGVN